MNKYSLIVEREKKLYYFLKLLNYYFYLIIPSIVKISTPFYKLFSYI